MKIPLKVLLLFFILPAAMVGQNDGQPDSVEVYIIDSFIPPENPDIFKLSFFTSKPAKSRVVLDGQHEFLVSDTLTEEHGIQIDLSKIEFKKKIIPYIIFVEDENGKTNRGEKSEFEIQEETKMEEESNFVLLCLFGGTVFLIPNPVLVITGDENYFSLTKEIALLTFRGSYRYPSGYISAEYSHIFGAPEKNFLRIGYKRIIEMPEIEYIMPGINGFTDFSGFNGISPEFSVGWFKIFNTFTVYTRYRFSFKPDESERNFHEISLGLYSSFFSFYF